MILNLGAGDRIIRGAVNHDIRAHRPEISVTHDLNEFPWPWGDEAVTRIEAWSIFEHLKPNLVEVLDECWRILVVGGLLHLKLPFWNVDQSWADPTHIWHYSVRSLDIFVLSTKLGRENDFYTGRKWAFIEEPSKVSHSSLSATMKKVAS